jgi:hypothetical protein
LLKVEKPVNDILHSTNGADSVSMEHGELRTYVNTSARKLAEKVRASSVDESCANDKDVDMKEINGTYPSTRTDEVFFGSFDEWLASFVPETLDKFDDPAKRLDYMRQERQKLTQKGAQSFTTPHFIL